MIKIIATGGTIDKVYFDRLSEFTVGPPQAEAILREAGVTVEFKVESLLCKDSLELTEEDRDAIRVAIASESAAQIIVTHGTDTMVQTALHVKGIPGKTIVFTGAMQPARLRASDAEFNLGMAVAAVQILPPGVYLALQGRLFDPSAVRKNRAENRFEDQPARNG